MKPKDWLFQNGHITKVGRGRLSAEHKALVEQAVAQGVQIEGYSVSSPATGAVDKPKVVKSRPGDATRVLDVPDCFRDEGAFDAFVDDNGRLRRIGMREVCNHCHNSFTYCRCNKPTFWVDYNRAGVVHFKPRSKG